MAERSTYHHGDLRNALLQATRELVRERGARGFSVSEAARRAGVSISAPYRHFADRDAMLAATAARAFAELETDFAMLALKAPLPECAAQIAVAYVAFARQDPARFEVMFASGIDKASHPELLEQARRVQERLEAALQPHVPREEVVGRAAELWAIAHGVASLTLGGNLRHVVDSSCIDMVAASAAHAWASGASGT
ncbi:TetR/AcrR family transcriptional regulator [Streptomyces sp. NPDC057654]|uniref:TetR/AcrR family transcriptional regulator n=1 Tax=Streptomyces sp. NPDC057654 TaxID=3346196 RepID=UPI0036C53AA1